jgi:hypothetical protein
MRGGMSLFAALAIGYVAGAKTGGKNFEELTRSLRALKQTDAEVAAMLRRTASLVDREPARPTATGDLVARVRYLVGDG